MAEFQYVDGKSCTVIEKLIKKEIIVLVFVTSGFLNTFQMILAD